MNAKSHLQARRFASRDAMGNKQLVVRRASRL